uniref:Uncharacterized protein n=1 Tax=Anguilla anguilla TaxID=7936 RepID=A0A0E9S9K7_ANGAN
MLILSHYSVQITVLCSRCSIMNRLSTIEDIASLKVILISCT